MSSLHFIVQPVPGSEDQLNLRLRDVAENVGKLTYSSPIPNCPNVVVKVIVIGPSFIALLFENGRVCRVSYNVQSDKLDLNKNDPKQSQAASATARSSQRRGRVLRAISRGRSGVIVGSRPLVPASVVPEELISQVQVVLQGKSRSLIIRELQRTNLDVNLAVNNLLSRDDVEGEDDDPDGDPYMAAEAALGVDHPSVIIESESIFSDEMLGYGSLRSRVRRAAEREAERESLFRIRDRRFLDTSLRDEINRITERTTQFESTSEPRLQNAISFSDDMTYWPGDNRFTNIVALFSELAGINIRGQLCQWKWADTEPYQSSDNPSQYHPKTSMLGLVGEVIMGIHACNVRCSLWTETGKVATYVDDTLNIVAAKLEQPAQIFSDFTADTIVELQVCSLFTCARLASGALFWWGVMPLGQRKKVVEKARAKAAKKNRADCKANDLQVGMQVCQRSSPIYNIGAIGFNVSDDTPKVGQLLVSAWSLVDTCRFKIRTSLRLNELKPEPKTDYKLYEQQPAQQQSSSTFKPDMPPPPSPASSTCSDHSGHSMVSPAHGLKRKRTQTPVKEVERRDEEEWCLNDVIFVEDIRTVPVGKILKVDGAYVAVRFPRSTETDGVPPRTDDPLSLLQDCRLMRKDELLVVKGTIAPRVPDCFQKTPRRVNWSEPGEVLALAVASEGIHCISKVGSQVWYVILDLSNGSPDELSALPTETMAFMGQRPMAIKLCNAGETCPVMLLDGNKTLYPLARDCTRGIKDPQWIGLPPISTMAMRINHLANAPTSGKTRAAIIGVVTEPQWLTQHIVRCDVDKVKSVLSSLETEEDPAARDRKISDIVGEYIDGNRNIIHACVTMATPTANTDVDVPSGAFGAFEASSAVSTAVDVLASIQSRMSDPNDRISSRSLGLREMMRRATSAVRSGSGLDMRSDREDLSIPSLWPAELPGFDPASIPGAANTSSSSSSGATNPSTTDQSSPWNLAPSDKDRRRNAVQILRMLCDSTLLEIHMPKLLSAKNAEGCTPFMQAVCNRSYPSALVILDLAKRLCLQNHDLCPVSRMSVLMEMLYPEGSSPDNNPIYVLCCNDNCSFTWTGDEHINQDIFECHTCGLLESLCCCTECARTCHKGHDCKLKKTRPTAYCDCWKGHCKSLIMGDQSTRLELLSKLLDDTNLGREENSRGEHLLLFLVHTVGRQQVEQRQYNEARSSKHLSRRRDPGLGLLLNDPDYPDHSLEPPRFSRRALDKVVKNWQCVSAMLAAGCAEPRASEPVFEDQVYLSSQSSSSRLDKFTYTLLVKCSVEVLDMLLTTLVGEMQIDNNDKQRYARALARRFVRSVARIFVVLSLEITPQNYKKKNAPVSQPLTKCRRVFQALINVAVEELCQMADSVIAPVRMGVARPTIPFSLVNSSSDALQGSEELFNTDPLPQRSSGDGADVSDTPHGTEPQYNYSHRGEDSYQNAMSDDQPLNEPYAEGDMSYEMNEMPEGDHNDDQQSVHSMGGDNQDDGAGADSDMELDLLAESDSDSDNSEIHSNHDNNSIQRSGVTAATAGSEPGVGSIPYFSEEDDDSGDETNHEDSEGEQSESLELDRTLDANLERRQGGNQRLMQAPPSMQWAIRARDTPISNPTPAPSRPSTAGVANASGSSGLMYIESSAARRSTNPTPTTANGGGSSAILESQQSCSVTVSQLARAFGIIIRQIADLLTMLQDYSTLAPALPRVLEVNYSEAMQLQMYLEFHLKPTWDWLIMVMDSTEAQLRFGSALSENTDPVLPMHPNLGAAVPVPSSTTVTTRDRVIREEQQLLHGLTFDARRRARLGVATTEGLAARRDFLSYTLSLMRSHTDEHGGSLPVIDILSLRHVAYVLDALIYYMRSGTDSEIVHNDTASVHSWADENLNEDPEENAVMDAESLDEEVVGGVNGRRHAFFQRSDSLTCIGGSSPDPFLPLAEALPMADQPHLLTPSTPKDHLVGMKRRTLQSVAADASPPFDRLPTHMGLSLRTMTFPSLSVDGSTSPSGPTAGAGTSMLEMSDVPASGVIVRHSATPADSSMYSGVPYYGEGMPYSPANMPQDLSMPRSSSSSGRQEDSQQASVIVSPPPANQAVLAPYSVAPPYMVAPPPPTCHSSPGISQLGFIHGAHPFEMPGPHHLPSGSQFSDYYDLPMMAQAGRLAMPMFDPAMQAPIVPPVPTYEMAVPGPSAGDPMLGTARSDGAPAQVASSSCRYPQGVVAESNDTSNRQRSGVSEYSETRSEATATWTGNSESTAADRTTTSTTTNSSQDLGDQRSDVPIDMYNVSNTVVIETSNGRQIGAPSMTTMSVRPQPSMNPLVSHAVLLGRWRLCLDMFGRVFSDDVGAEPGSVINELGGFPVKEARFRREMEKLRNSQTRDLTLEVERDRNALLLQTFKQLNNHYSRRGSNSPPLAVHRCKVTFKDEPGEGSGVARSFYTAFAQAVLAGQQMPSLDGILTDNKSYHYHLYQKLRVKDRELQALRRAPRTGSSVRRPGPLTYESIPFYPSGTIPPASDMASSNMPSGQSMFPTLGPAHNVVHRRQFGDRLYAKVASMQPNLAAKITGMLLDLPPTIMLNVVTSDEDLRQKVEDCVDIILSHSSGESSDIGESNLLGLDRLDPFTSVDRPKKSNTMRKLTEEAEEGEDNNALFWQPGKRGFYSPQPGRNSAERLNAFRNVGRVIGLCLLQNEMCPLYLSRHVLKFILGRRITWHDMAFMDPIMFESLRHLVVSAENKKDALAIFQALDLTFHVQLAPEEGNCGTDLVNCGSEIEVNPSNVHNYVRKYAELRMVKVPEKALEAMRLGVFDVLPRGSLEGLAAEDLRLLLNGVGDINVQTLISYTSFNDESGESSDKVQRFKRWFWNIVEKMTNSERQDLVYFWMSSPALPASEEGFQPMPSVTVRPVDDTHLPTANTCISRLYVPLYSSKNILRCKLLQAITTKSFGFV